MFSGACRRLFAKQLTVSSQKTIWYINKYASPPGSNGGLRGLSLAREFVKLGHLAVVINSRANHYVNHRSKKSERVFGAFAYAEHWGVPTFTHQTLTYKKTASMRRILSWLHFEWGLLWLKKEKLPTPSHIIVSSLSLLTILNGYRLARKSNARLIFEIRDIWPLSMTTRAELSKTNPFVSFLSWVEKFGYTKADVVVGQMPNLVQHVEETVGKGPIVRTVGLGIDPDLEEALRHPKELHLKSEIFRVVYAGSIGRSNALETLLNVARSLDSDKSITFELFGQGDYLKTFEKHHADFTRIIFHGPVPRQKLLRELRDADILFLAVDQSPVWRYGQSLHKLVDYMAMGRPIIAAYDGYPSMINEAKCGFFVPPDNFGVLRQKILEAKSMSPEKLKSIGNNGKEWITNNRTYQKLAEDYLCILETADQKPIPDE